jgi:hypothetical protein
LAFQATLRQVGLTKHYGGIKPRSANPPAKAQSIQRWRSELRMGRNYHGYLSQFIFTAEVFLLAQFLCFQSLVAQQNVQLIKTEYDEKKDFTQLTLNPIILASRKLEELRLGAVTGYPGKVKSKPKDIALVFLSLSKTEENRYESARKLIIVADERRFDWGEMKRSKQAQNGLFMETMTTTVPIDDFLFVTGAKHVKVRVGLTEVDLTTDQLSVLRLLASYIVE